MQILDADPAPASERALAGAYTLGLGIAIGQRIMFPVVVLLFSAFGVFNLSRASEVNSSLKLTTHVYSLLVNAPAKNARVAGTIVELDYLKTLTPDFEVRVNGGMRLEGGSSRALYDDEFAPRQTPLLRESSVTWAPLHACKVAVGSLNQNFLNAPLISKDQSFPGAHESCATTFGGVELKADLEQTYATDTQFTHPTGRTLQSDAEFFIERVGATYQVTPSLQGELHLSHYLFSGLSALVAYQSQFMGNTSSGLDENNADFRYDYQPFELGGGLFKSFSKANFQLRFDAVQNPSAPSGANSAFEVEAKSRFKGSTNIDWEPSLRYFSLQSDATPSYFNDPSTAHANSRGFGLGTSVYLLQSNAEAILQYSVSWPMATTLYQPGSQEWAFAALRLHYDLL